MHCASMCCIPPSVIEQNFLLSHAVAHDAVVVTEDSLRDIITQLCWSTTKCQQSDPSGSVASLSLLTFILDRLLARKLNLLYKKDQLG